MDLKIIYEDENLLAIDKPAGIIVFPEGNIKEKTLIGLLLEKYPGLSAAGPEPRYGIAHRLDKETSGVILVAKNEKTLFFLQKQFKTRGVEKKYIALVIGNLESAEGVIETLIGRAPKDRKKQRAYSPVEPDAQNKKSALTEYKVLERFNGYTLLEITPKTGRKHQIRCHLAYLKHPIAGDKIYGFKNQPIPEGLKRHFLHASYLKFNLPNGEAKEIKSELPEELEKVLEKIYNFKFYK